MPMQRRPDELLNALARVAPGTPLRDGLERIVRAKMGALLVLSDDPAVLEICSGGFLLDAPFSPQRLSELAKMDGAIILNADLSRIARANVHLLPDASVPTAETGTRHRTAERVARSLSAPVVSVSEEMSVINLYAGANKHQLQEVGRLLDRANQALQTLERYKVRLDDAMSNLTAQEVEDVVSLRDVASVVQRGEMVHRIAEEIETMIVELGVDARLLRLQLDELYGEIDDELDLVIRDYTPVSSAVEDVHTFMARLDDDGVLDLRRTAVALDPVGGADDLDGSVSSRGMRLLARVPRVSDELAAAVTDHFGELTKLQRATVADLMEVPGMSPAQAQAIKDTLERVVESTIMDQYN
ncbi:MAG TPA: DNA integrity scanning diadenylate cyclase DisA [Ilumatobacteraceae bacterium]|nr:DNA integrity scanning diadenylate cyclase DisA [Ilumatobacteraceae bacterium]